MVFCAKGAEARCETCPITNDSASACKFAVEFQPIVHAHWVANGVHPTMGQLEIGSALIVSGFHLKIVNIATDAVREWTKRKNNFSSSIGFAT